MVQMFMDILISMKMCSLFDLFSFQFADLLASIEGIPKVYLNRFNPNY